jgi:alcohol dehydrogenase class IV
LIKPFIYTVLPQRVIFGIDAIAGIAAEADGLGIKKALIVSTPGQSRNSGVVAGILGDRVVEVFDKAEMHVPLAVVNAALALLASVAADGVIAVGGGSAIGLAKMIALSTGIPIVAVPTTYAGSEMTSIYGFTGNGTKKTGRDPRVLPRSVIYDPALTASLPSSTSAASGMNAIAHSVEALYAVDTNPVVGLMAQEAIRAMAEALPALTDGAQAATARSTALYGAWLSASAFASVSMGLHHKLCHVLGGAFDLPHAETHSIVLPYVARYNEEAAPEAMARIARALGASDAPTGLFNLVARLGLETKLAGLGMREKDLTHAARLVSEVPYPNPAPIVEERVLEFLKKAYWGANP